jgi:hypothetical protein
MHPRGASFVGQSFRGWSVPGPNHLLLAPGSSSPDVLHQRDMVAQVTPANVGMKPVPCTPCNLIEDFAGHEKPFRSSDSLCHMTGYVPT